VVGRPGVAKQAGLEQVSGSTWYRLCIMAIRAPSSTYHPLIFITNEETGDLCHLCCAGLITFTTAPQNPFAGTSAPQSHRHVLRPSIRRVQSLSLYRGSAARAIHPGTTTRSGQERVVQLGRRHRCLWRVGRGRRRDDVGRVDAWGEERDGSPRRRF
jgi:hypothetical protein